MAGNIRDSGTAATGSGISISGITINTQSSTLSYDNPYAGTNASIFYDLNKASPEVIHPKLFFSLVKSKMSETKKEKLKEQLSKLKKLVKEAKLTGQQALYEEFSKRILVLVRELEMGVCDIRYSVPKNVIDRFCFKVRGPKVHMDPLTDYARPVPTKVSKKIKKLRDLGIFDSFWVLYLEYDEKIDVNGEKKIESSKLKTNKEKIREKDPILFGRLDVNPEKLYYITDWVDEYCDLTLDKFIEDIKESDPDYELDKLEGVSEEVVKRIIHESAERTTRLNNARPSNFRSLMAEEDRVNGGNIRRGWVKVTKRIASIFRTREKTR